ncbi:unnamed protein product [Symbiodinium sp. KB8]|nr:unnamed protein product [Symbiodinium sp. KB8]
MDLARTAPTGFGLSLAGSLQSKARSPRIPWRRPSTSLWRFASSSCWSSSTPRRFTSSELGARSSASLRS